MPNAYCLPLEKHRTGFRRVLLEHRIAGRIDLAQDHLIAPQIGDVLEDPSRILLLQEGLLQQLVVHDQAPVAFEVDVHHQYPNMKAHLAPYPEVVTAAERAIAAEGLEAKRTVIRGGTDGSRLSAMGLPTPNIFTGGHEFHSAREWVTVQDMAAAAAVIVRLAEQWHGA